MHAEWKQSIKSDQKKVLAKNLEIKKARQIQLDQLEARQIITRFTTHISITNIMTTTFTQIRKISSTSTKITLVKN